MPCRRQEGSAARTTCGFRGAPGGGPQTASPSRLCAKCFPNTLPLICMTSPTPFTEANTEPQRVETREAACPPTHTLRRLRPDFRATTQRARNTGAPKACSAGSRSPSAWLLAAHTYLPRADRHCSRCLRPRRSRGVGKGSRPGAPGCRAGGPPESAGEQRAVRTGRRSGEVAGAAQGGRIDLGARGTVRGAGAAAARGVRRRILVGAGLGQPADRGGALVRREHAAALTWPPPGGRPRSCSCQEGVQAPARESALRRLLSTRASPPVRGGPSTHPRRGALPAGNPRSPFQNH